ncbi:hypothetical protein Plec18170_007554, partial [Paecilomyces lecythidis]
MEELKKNQFESPEVNTKDGLQCGVTISIECIPPLLQRLTDEERAKMEKQLVRKLDLMLMPMNAIAAAKLAGITEELKLSSVQFQ